MPDDPSNVSWMHARRPGLAHQATVQQLDVERLHDVVDDTQAICFDKGLRQGYIEGARAGRLAGLLWGLVLGSVAVASAFKLGWMAGGGS